METQKKNRNIGALLMVFLCGAIIFSILAYGYGQANMAKETHKWYTNNLNTLCEDKGYVKPLINDINRDIPFIPYNIPPSNCSSLNLTCKV